MLSSSKNYCKFKLQMYGFYFILIDNISPAEQGCKIKLSRII